MRKNRPVRCKRKDADKGTKLLQEDKNVVFLTLRALDNLVEIVLRNQHATLHNVHRNADGFGNHILVVQLLEQLDVDVQLRHA